MELTQSTASGYALLAFDEMVTVAERLGDDLVNQRPLGSHTNSVAAIVIHCCGVCEFWLGHVGLGRPSDRDRDAEFSATATLAELREMVAVTQTQVDDDLTTLESGSVQSDQAEGRLFLPVDTESDASLVLHVIEELFQHLGHCELAADALLM